VMDAIEQIMGEGEAASVVEEYSNTSSLEMLSQPSPVLLPTNHGTIILTPSRKQRQRNASNGHACSDSACKHVLLPTSSDEVNDELNDQSHDQLNESQQKLLSATALCTIFMIAEFVGGYFAHSLAIMTDAAHLLTDVAGMAISIAAVTLAKQHATADFTFGFQRMEILGALLSVLLIWVLTAFLVYEAIYRILDPQYVDGKLMLIIACLGLVINLLMLCVLGGHGHSHGGQQCSGGHGGADAVNINVMAAYIHVVGDLVQTIGVIIAAVLIWWQPFDVGQFPCSHDLVAGCSRWTYADPVCTILFAFLVLGTTAGIIRESLNVLMVRTPSNVQVHTLLQEVQCIDGVETVHQLQVWALSTGQNLCSMRLQINVPDPTDTILASALDSCYRCNIAHPCIQIQHTDGVLAPHTSQRASTFGFEDDPRMP